MLEKQGKPPLVLAAGFALVGFIGVVDFMTGYEIGFSLFYLFPVSLVTWLTRRRFGLLTSFAAASAWYWADAATGHSYSHALIPLWNTLVRLGFFVIITLLLSALRRAMEREKELARTDNLTGAVKDRFGHPEGDKVLRIVANSARKNLRKTDVFGRLGGDEFAMLLPETNEESARVVLSKVQCGLLEEMYSVKRDGRNAIKYSTYAG